MKENFFTLFWFFMAAFAGTALYATSEKTHAAARELAALQLRTAETRHDIAVLTAEWHRLTAPQRLEELAARHLPEMRPMTGAQIIPAHRPDAPRKTPAPAAQALSVKDLIDRVLAEDLAQSDNTSAPPRNTAARDHGTRHQ
ncbi:MAG: hypothetical protein EA357_01840 [Micavibrio sp.]|nr:MAG: hypothetical protein EA357_01840 [Micavibrio sp.]